MIKQWFVYNSTTAEVFPHDGERCAEIGTGTKILTTRPGVLRILSIDPSADPYNKFYGIKKRMNCYESNSSVV